MIVVGGIVLSALLLLLSIALPALLLLLPIALPVFAVGRLGGLPAGLRFLARTAAGCASWAEDCRLACWLALCDCISCAEDWRLACWLPCVDCICWAEDWRLALHLLRGGLAAGLLAGALGLPIAATGGTALRKTPTAATAPAVEPPHRH